MYAWGVERRKQLAMPLIRSLRPPPDPEDPDTTGVAFRPREQAGVKRQRTNNKKTFALMTQLRDEFRRLRQSNVAQTMVEKIAKFCAGNKFEPTWLRV